MRTRVALSALVISLALPAASAAGQADGTAPAPGSPSEAIYQLPLDSGRDDAAPSTPRAPGGGAGDTTTPPQDGGGTSPGPTEAGNSRFQSENGYGSSSRVPGVRLAERGGTARERGHDAPAAGSRQTEASLPARAERVRDEAPGAAGTFVLLALVLIIASSTGLVAGRVRAQ